MFIVLDNKTGFSCPQNELFIYDGQGNLFYNMRNHTGNIIFNLPKGVYSTDNEIFELDSPIPFTLPKLATPERYISRPKDGFEIIVGENENKCSVVMGGDKTYIIADHSMLLLPEPYWTFIKTHEVGHFRYHSEIGADRFARYKMLEKGYNPSQIYYANIRTLSNKPHLLDRKFNALADCINAFNFLRQ